MLVSSLSLVMKFEPYLPQGCPPTAATFGP